MPGEMPPLCWMDAKVFRAHAKEGCAVDLGLSTHEVGLLRMQVFPILVLPGLLGVIAIIQENRGGVPVQFFLWHERSAFEDQDLLASLRKMERKRSATRAGSNYDRVIGSAHGVMMRIGSMRSLL